MKDIAADARWLTYAEAGQLMGIDPESVKRKAQRGGWPRRAGNDRKTRVAVPSDMLPPEAVPGDVPGDSVPGTSPPRRGRDDGLAALAAMLKSAHEELAAARADLAKEQRRRTEIETRLDTLLREERFLARRGLAARLRRIGELRFTE